MGSQPLGGGFRHSVCMIYCMTVWVTLRLQYATYYSTSSSIRLEILTSVSFSTKFLTSLLVFHCLRCVPVCLISYQVIAVGQTIDHWLKINMKNFGDNHFLLAIQFLSLNYDLKLKCRIVCSDSLSGTFKFRFGNVPVDFFLIFSHMVGFSAFVSVRQCWSRPWLKSFFVFHRLRLSF